MNVELGRNDPCWCGSGKKYKKCHLSEDQAKGGQGGGVGAATRQAAVARLRNKNDKLILNRREQEGMRAAGRWNASLLDKLRQFAVPGTRLRDVDDFVKETTLDAGHTPACLGYRGAGKVPFPATLCTSVNEVICHGIPGDYVLQEGDIVNFDITTIVNGWHGDQSETFLIGEVSDMARKVTQCAFDCLYAGIGAIKPGGRIRDIGGAIVKLAHGRGLSVVEDFQGHGIGRKFHQDPGVPHYPERHYGNFVVQPGMCFTIEPMINEGSPRQVTDKRDGWTARTVDGKLSAQFEHTILMTEDGPEILTLTEHGPRPGHQF